MTIERLFLERMHKLNGGSTDEMDEENLLLEQLSKKDWSTTLMAPTQDGVLLRVVQDE